MKALRHPPQRLATYLSTQQYRHASAKSRKTSTARQEREMELADLRSTLRTRLRSARTARREEWTLGPLAPRKDVGDEEFGCVSVREMTGVKGRRTEDRARGRMSWEESLIEERDRVVIVARNGPESRDRGRIGTVTEVRQKQREVIVEDLNLADIKVPPYILASEPSSPPIRTVPLPIPLSSIRLVYPLTIDGVQRDCIIEKLIRLPGRENENRRFIANSDKAAGEFIEVPVRGKKDEEMDKKDHDSDTLRFEVEEQTWTPTLLRAPMPGGVIDELRNKYSEHRTRHEPGYLLAMENREKRKAEYKAWAKSGGTMLMTPAREARLKERAEMAEKGKPVLGEEVLERIGEVMAGKGIEMTEERRREVERNLEREGEGVLGPFRMAEERRMKEMRATEREEVEEMEEEGVEEEGRKGGFGMLGVDEVGVGEEEAPSRRDWPRV